MHPSELEKHREEKEHKMRHGYRDRSNQRFPHDSETNSQPAEEIPQNNYGPGAP